MSERDYLAVKSAIGLDNLVAQLSREDQVLAVQLLQQHKQHCAEAKKRSETLQNSDASGSFGTNVPLTASCPSTSEATRTATPPTPLARHVRLRRADAVQAAVTSGGLEPEHALFRDFKFDSVIFTDGAASPNPGVGGYGTVIMRPGEPVVEWSKGYQLSTNNRMELRGVLKALKSIRQGENVAILSDSKYIVDAVNQGWVRAWLAKPVAKHRNPDLWDKIVYYLDRHTGGDLVIAHVKAHSGILGNERADGLAGEAQKMAGQSGAVKEDSGYWRYCREARVYTGKYAPRGMDEDSDDGFWD
ncbi:RNase H [Carpediemonas membranifera]|uniref:ribonuclease H n=1 Tax=Carpediemonas membranifera TaxID=201153 RepID=A0A8J6B659_9EUKA|nr:RNase H [Carpediemonas membranifera]|eukprot:KAG9393884.1 RNase H [Carpediemonas membranifera]